MSAQDVQARLLALATGDSDPRVLRMSRHRELPALWRDFGYTQGAEIGVEQGRYSETLLTAMPALTLRCVDFWGAYRGYRDHVSQEKLDGFYADTQARLARFGDRVRICRGPSLSEAGRVADGSLDFVYIDANHTLPHVIADLAAWVPKVRSGGMVAGHDYGRRSVGHVREAVQAWTAAYGLTPWFVTQGDKSPSFLWVQP